MYEKDAVNMIRHNNKRIERNERKEFWYSQPMLSSYLSYWGAL
jgi:hypothetical protein